MLEGLTTFLARPELAPTKGDDVPCGSTTCYTVNIELTPEELAALTGEAGGDAAPQRAADPAARPRRSLGVDLTIRVEQDTTRLAGLTAVISMGGPVASGATASGGSGTTVDVTFSKWDESVTVTAPPADQVQPAG